ncbi:TetR/AcrR family transcriptional regulator [Nonomuraea soli]|uniref:AcrR family transcriptional regulator n=1 Tax=Nonomuraea soli TaxID=1032476 RepID=A0A7W0CPE7_9ACTN|nr:TetR/AcrR family transcriptional regulator [Nonomuraea soli]MBA2894882.1 AcrR family transcriptional regulator [Nonomuraea soli]
MAVSREQILDAAIRHLNASPTASMAQIAEAAGISRATLHRHFSSRDDLVVELGRRALDRWERAQDEAGIAETGAGPADLRATLMALIEGEVGVAEEHGFTLTVETTSEELLARSAELERRELAFIEACQRAGVLRSDLPAVWVSSSIYGLLVALRESLRRGEIAPREATRLMVESFLRGASDKGDLS